MEKGVTKLIKPLRLLTRIGNYKIGFNGKIVISKVHDRKGVSNWCADGMRIQFIDFATDALTNGCINDNIHENGILDNCIEKIVYSCELNQNAFSLGDYYVIQSYPRLSFHAFCLDKLPLELDRVILANTRYADLMYVMTYSEKYKGYMPTTPDYKVLRYTEKSNVYPDEQLKCIGIIKSKHNSRIKSLMHNIFFNLRYGIPIYRQELTDNSKLENLHIDTYESLR